MHAECVGSCSARTRDHPQRSAALRDNSQGGGKEVLRTSELLHAAALPPLQGVALRATQAGCRACSRTQGQGPRPGSGCCIVLFLLPTIPTGAVVCRSNCALRELHGFDFCRLSHGNENHVGLNFERFGLVGEVNGCCVSPGIIDSSTSCSTLYSWK